MPLQNKKTTTKAIIDILFEGNNLVKVLAFAGSILLFGYGIGYFFGELHEAVTHNTEINSLNLQHNKDLNAEIDKRRAAENKLNEQNLANLKSAIIQIQKQVNEKD